MGFPYVPGQRDLTPYAKLLMDARLDVLHATKLISKANHRHTLACPKDLTFGEIFYK
jgi:hypothetical protein